MAVLTGPGEAGCFRQVAALYSDTIDSSTVVLPGCLDRWLYCRGMQCGGANWARGGWLF